jgi:large subunit ribosomal protein L34
MHGRNVRKSNLKKKRKCGFMARMKSRFGRKVLNRRRSIGRKLLPKF